MMVGTRLLLRVAKVTSTAADHSTRPPTKIRTQLGPSRGVRVSGSAAVVSGTVSATSCVMTPSLGWLQSQAARYRRGRLSQQAGYQVDGGRQDDGAQQVRQQRVAQHRRP